MAAILEANGLARTYRSLGTDVLALRGVDIALEPGEFVAVMGPSGSGKSTLLHLLGGLDRPSPARVRLDGERIDDRSEAALALIRRRRLGFVFQLVALANLLTTALLSVRERVRDLGILKAVGLTPRNVGTSVMSANGLLGAIAALLGIPVGVGFFLGVYALANGSLDGVAIPPWWQLALILPAAVLVVALVAGVPARIAARIRVVDALRYE